MAEDVTVLCPVLWPLPSLLKLNIAPSHPVPITDWGGSAGMVVSCFLKPETYLQRQNGREHRSKFRIPPVLSKYRFMSFQYFFMSMCKHFCRVEIMPYT